LSFGEEKKAKKETILGISLFNEKGENKKKINGRFNKK